MKISQEEIVKLQKVEISNTTTFIMTMNSELGHICCEMSAVLMDGSTEISKLKDVYQRATLIKINLESRQTGSLRDRIKHITGSESI